MNRKLLHYYYLVEKNFNPLMMGCSVFCLMIELLLSTNVGSFLVVLFFLICSMFNWFLDVVLESAVYGWYSKELKSNFLLGFALFLLTEILIFLSLFVVSLFWISGQSMVHNEIGLVPVGFLLNEFCSDIQMSWVILEPSFVSWVNFSLGHWNLTVEDNKVELIPIVMYVLPKFNTLFISASVNTLLLVLSGFFFSLIHFFMASPQKMYYKAYFFGLGLFLLFYLFGIYMFFFFFSVLKKLWLKFDKCVNSFSYLNCLKKNLMKQ